VKLQSMKWLVTLIPMMVGSIAQATFDCTDLNPTPLLTTTFPTSPTSDFALRSSLPSTEISRTDWATCCGSFGPCPNTYPAVSFPVGIDRLSWARQRLLQAAKQLIGTPYAHFHIPEMGGLDCSNFTAFAYNYAFGTRFSSNVERQAGEAGKKLLANEQLKVGDLVFFYDDSLSKIVHVAIYVDPVHLIDSTGPRVAIRRFEGWYRRQFAFARRVLD
jgi:hypothetical protein